MHCTQDKPHGGIIFIKNQLAPQRNPNKEWFVSQVDGHNLSRN